MSTVWGLIKGTESGSVKDLFMGVKNASAWEITKGSRKSIGEMFRTGP